VFLDMGRARVPRLKPALRARLFHWTEVQLPLLKQGAPTNNCVLGNSDRSRDREGSGSYGKPSEKARPFAETGLSSERAAPRAWERRRRASRARRLLGNRRAIDRTPL